MSAALGEALRIAQEKARKLGDEAAKRKLTDDEHRTFAATMDEIEDLNDRIAQHAKAYPYQRTAAASIRDAALQPTGPAASSAGDSGFGGVQVRTDVPDAGVYGYPGAPDMLGDMVAWRMGTANDEQRSRVERHQNWAVESRALTTTDAAGGYFVPSITMSQRFLAERTKGAPLLNHVTRIPLSSVNRGATDTVTIPKFTSGTSVDWHTQGSALSNTDAVFETITASVRPMGGQQVLSGFLRRRSDIPGMDTVILQNLTAKTYQKIGLEMMTGTTPWEGILNADSTGTTTFTSGSPTAELFYQSVLSGMNDVAGTHRSLDGAVVVMHSRRWTWYLGQCDDQGRPIAETTGGSGMNVSGVQVGHAAEGYAGTIAGFPVILDDSIPTNTGAGTNQDSVVCGVLRDTCVLVDEAPRFAISEHARFGEDDVVVKVVYDGAFTPEAYPGALSLVTGTGLSATL